MGTAASDLPAIRKHLCVRSQSFSTLDGRRCQGHDDHSVRIVIDQQALAKRPRTTESDAVPQLEIPIPHYRLGNPYFSQRGTPILRSSIYTRGSGTDDIRSSYLSKVEYDRLFPHPVTVPHHSTLNRRHSESFRQPHYNMQNQLVAHDISAAATGIFDGANSGTSAAATQTSAAGYTLMPIVPEIFDIIAANPNDPCVVRYSNTGEMIAATPSRLIDHITSPTFLDYELLSDFFLTCRSFLKAADLISYLIARLRWALKRDNDLGRIVRVRTFVALRHWILNYFVDDFIPDFALRFQFCKAVNDLSKELQSKSGGATGDIKIIGELKKCWRRTCALYWDNPSPQKSRPIEVDIHPGDPVHVTSNFDTPSTPFLSRVTGQASDKVQSQETAPLNRQPWQSTLDVMSQATGKMKPLPDPHLTLASGRMVAQVGESLPLSPMSEHSIQAASCSIPRFATPRIGCASDRPQMTHGNDAAKAPVVSRATRMYPPISASTAIANDIKNSTRRTGRHKHKRSGSFSDALRDERAPLSQPLSTLNDVHRLTTTEILSNDNTGSLIRGAVVPPVEPYIEITKRNHLASMSQLNVNISQNVGISGDNTGYSSSLGIKDNLCVNGDANMAISAMLSSNPGVKKILGSFRRAMSGRPPSEKIYTGRLNSQTSKAALTTVSTTPDTGSSLTTVTGGNNNYNNYNSSGHRNVAKGARRKRRRDRDRDKDDKHAQVRVDLMAAKAVTSYKEALMAKDALGKEKETRKMAGKDVPSTSPNEMTSSKANVDALGVVDMVKANGGSFDAFKAKERSDGERTIGGITPGSRSIIIADDTSPLDMPPLPSHTEPYSLAGVMDNAALQQHDRQQVNEDCLPLTAHQYHLAKEVCDQNDHDPVILTASLLDKQNQDYDFPPRPLRNPRSVQSTIGNAGADADIHSRPVQEVTASPLKKSKSIRSQQSGSVSLRRYASYQSGIATQRFQPQHQMSGSVDAVTLTDVRSASPQLSSPAPSLSSFPSPSDGKSAQKPQAMRQLRRRPGGDLRAYGNIHELERPRSTGSVSNRTHSITNSMSYKPSDGHFMGDQRVSRAMTDLSQNYDNALATSQGGLVRRPYSLVQTHSSQPNLRPSFEAEVAKLAALPDEDDEAAGIEAALLKLEGRFQKGELGALVKFSNRRSRKTLSQQKLHVDYSDLDPKAMSGSEGLQDLLSGPSLENDAAGESRRSLLSKISDNRRLPNQSSLVEGHDETTVVRSKRPRKQSLATSDDSYSSLPLLQRGLSQGANSNWRKAGEDFKIGNLQAAAQTKASIENEANNTSFFLSPQDTSPVTVSRGKDNEPDKRTSLRNASPSPGRKSIHSATARDSFLLDSDQSLSDVASDISTGDLIMSTISGSQQVVSFYDDGVNYGFSRNNFRDEDKSLTFQYPSRHPPTPPLSEGSVNGAVDTTRPLVHSLLQHQEAQLHRTKKELSIPAAASKAVGVSQYFPHPPLSPIDATGIELRQMQVKDESSISHPFPNSSSPTPLLLKHIPFILAYDSEILAQQFTIIEKDALDEIDWKELIELRWNQSATGVQTWVEYLLRDSTKPFEPSNDYSGKISLATSIGKAKQHRGVDIAIARFNLMVKWAISECVLTQDIEERARVFVKYIHIAAHAKRLRNYATMYQVTIALLSSDCSRLTRTWDLVPETERETLHILEKLVQPLRNFSNLRHEMETAPLEDGCIPFIGK